MLAICGSGSVFVQCWLPPSYLPRTARSSLVVYSSISFLLGATQAPIRRVNINSGWGVSHDAGRGGAVSTPSPAHRGHAHSDAVSTRWPATVYAHTEGMDS